MRRKTVQRDAPRTRSCAGERGVDATKADDERLHGEGQAVDHGADDRPEKVKASGWPSRVMRVRPRAVAGPGQRAGKSRGLWAEAPVAARWLPEGPGGTGSFFCGDEGGQRCGQDEQAQRRERCETQREA